MQRTLNLGILAHVDAGKTSLTERLLYDAGVIDEIGSVDTGSTQTDSLALERQRGITIKSAVVSFVIADVTVNLIDTPGHPDFIAEVERVLSVLDGAVLVISAVEGVQAQTRLLMRVLRRLHIPTLIFVNKIDRRGAHSDRLLEAIAAKLAPSIIPMGSVDLLGTRAARFRPYADTDAEFRTQMIDVLATHDDSLLATYVHDEAAVSDSRLRAALVAQTRRAQVHPVFFGSASTGAGVTELSAGIAELLPSTNYADAAHNPASGAVFKVERGMGGEKIAYVRMFSGTVRLRDRLPIHRDTEPDGAGKVTAISVFDHGSVMHSDSVTAGQIGKLWGLADVRIGDVLGVPTTTAPAGQQFAPPTLETVVLPVRANDKAALHAALTQLTEHDPLINLRQDEIRQEMSVSLYGEVQKEVIQTTLADEYGIAVTFTETTTICMERPVGTGTAIETMKHGDNPFLATVGLRVEPGELGSGVTFQLEVELGAMPYAFFRAVEDTVRDTLHQGIHGWQVTDCVVTMTRSGYAPRQSHAHARFDKTMSSTGEDFRGLTPLVLMAALRRAGTQVYEPMQRFQLDIPADTLGSVQPVLVQLGAIPTTAAPHDASYLLSGNIPAARVHELERQIPGLTHGEGVLDSAFDHYRPVKDTIPNRPRWDHNPLNRKEYLLHVLRRF